MSVLSVLAEDLDLPAIFTTQLENSDRITMWNEELNLCKSRVWDVYTNSEGEFKLRLEFQGMTDLSEDNYPLVELPEDIASVAKTEHSGYWKLQGYVALNPEDLEHKLQAALESFAAWTKEAQQIAKTGGKADEKTRPWLFFKALNEESALQLLCKLDKEGRLTFSGWGFQHLYWGGKGLGGEWKQLRFQLGADVLAGKPPQPKQVEAGAPSVPPAKVVTPPPAPPNPPTRRGRGGNNQPPAVDLGLLAGNV